MKFRCEREVLADALATAGRAATSRTGTLPVLSGLRLEVHRRRAVGHRHRPRAVDPADGRRRRRARRRRRSSRRASWPTSCGRCPPGAVEVALADDERRSASAPGARSSRSARWPRRLPDAGRAGRRGGHAVVGVGRRGAAPGRAGGQHRRCPGRAHRRADRGRGRRRADGRHRLVPPGRARPARDRHAGRRPEGARAEPGAQRAAAGARRSATSCTVRLGARDAVFESGGDAADDPADRGRVPELPQPAAVVVPEPADGRARGAARGAAAGEDPGPGRHAGAPGARRRHAAC